MPPGLNDLLGKDDNIHSDPPLSCEGTSDIIHCPPGSRLAPSANNSQFLHPPDDHDAGRVVDARLSGDLSPAHLPGCVQKRPADGELAQVPEDLDYRPANVLRSGSNGWL